ncbi:MAG: leucine-rich repeat domain-containing protein [Clostridia bacterium]|nr:leucine-rich repeat domain-containing protein [Clostridia bacterium]
MRRTLKRTLTILLCALLLSSVLSIFPVSAAGSPLTFALSTFVEDDYAILVSCDTNASGKIVVPGTAKIDGKTYNVKFIGKKAFSGCDKVTEITIPEGVTQIENKAFENCTSLKTVNIPSTLMSCQYDAFNGCEDVTVNCHESNYQFFAVYGFSDNIHVNVVDSDMTPEQTHKMNTLVDFIKQFFNWLVNLFKGRKK